MLASEVMDEAASLMNDTGKLTWGYTQLLPYLQRAYRTLELNMFLNGVRSLKEVSAVIPVSKGSVEVILPQDFVQPISMGDRTPGSSNGFGVVLEGDWDLDPQSDSIRYWVWREDTLKINAPKTDREIFLRYRKGLSTIIGENSNITVPMSKS